MTKDELIEARLEQINETISAQPQTLAIIRPQENDNPCSIKENDCDIRLVVLVATGSEEKLLRDIRWLADIQHIAYEFKRSPGHFRFLFSDGLFCDFTVAEEQKLDISDLSHGQILWQKDKTKTDYKDVINITQIKHSKSPITKHEESCWLLGEFLTNLLIGLRRYSKGDKLSAFYIIQHHALSQLLELVDKWEDKIDISIDSAASQQTCKSCGSKTDELNIEPSSFEANYPQMVPLVEEFALGYDRSPKSAHAMLQYVEQHDTINYFIKDQIINLIKPHSNLH